MLFFENVVFARVVVEHFRYRALKADFVRAAVRGGNVVYVGINVFAITFGVLNCNRHFEMRFFRFHVKGLVVKHGSAFVEILHVIGNTTLVAERIVFARAAVESHTQIVDDYRHALIEIRNVAHTLLYHGIIEFFFAENSLVGLELDGSAGAFHLADDGERSFHNAAFHFAVAHLRRPKFRTIKIAVSLDVNREPLGKSVRDGRTDSVQTARIVVLSVVEFRTCVQLRENHFHTAYLQFRVFVNGNTASVVADSCNVVVQKFDADGVAEAVCHFVDTVVDNLPKDMMHTLAPGRADIHAGTFSDSVETFENVNVPRLVRVVLICHKYLRKVII